MRLCASCEWFDGPKLKAESGKGPCRKALPAIAKETVMGQQIYFPIVNSHTDWCSEFKECNGQ